MVPRAVGELAAIALTAATTYVINTFVVHDKQMKKVTKHLASFFASSFCYPFHVRLSNFQLYPER